MDYDVSLLRPIYDSFFSRTLWPEIEAAKKHQEFGLIAAFSKLRTSI